MIHKGREDEWKQIRSDMKAGSGATQVDVSTVFSGGKSSMAQIVNKLEEELHSQQLAVEEFSKPNWDQAEQMVAEGWCEALEFAIKTIRRHNKG